MRPGSCSKHGGGTERKKTTPMPEPTHDNSSSYEVELPWSARSSSCRCVWVALALGLLPGGQGSGQERPPGDSDRERLARSPRQVAEQLVAVYGHRLDQVAYIPALPLIAKLRLAEAT